MPSKILKIIFGLPLNPFKKSTRKHISLVAFVAWVGLGADALSSSCYGPEESYVALGANSNLAVFIALATVLTIFIISMGYRQVIELFPTGGGGYKVATKLLHPLAGLVSGAALIVDYVLTITVSIASGVDAVLSFLPAGWEHYQLYFKAAFVLLLLIMNVRGMKETIQVLMPVFLGFFIVHVFLIIYGAASHPQGLAKIIPDAIADTHVLTHSIGLLAVVGLILHAFSLGAGTYTGLEAVANNVYQLSEPRVETGKTTMLYMAISLSIIAGGIMMLYLLWNVHPVAGQTLNAVVFQHILGNSLSAKFLLILALTLEGGILFVAANTGFAGGPVVLANMAIDSWLPHSFYHLSNRLVIQNGLILLGVAALAILFWSRGKVSLLVILYSINVFITFTLALLSISVYWLKNRAKPSWKWNFLNSVIGFITTLSILCITVFFKFKDGGWLTLLITAALVALCLVVNRLYKKVGKKLRKLDKKLILPLKTMTTPPPKLDPAKPAAVILVGKSLSMGMNTLTSALRLFPSHFTNIIFMDIGVVDVHSFKGEEELKAMRATVTKTLAYFVKFAHQNGYAAEGYSAFGAEPMQQLIKLSRKVSHKYSAECVFFAGKIMFKHNSFITDFLYDQAAPLFQQYLNQHGQELMIVPMKI